MNQKEIDAVESHLEDEIKNIAGRMKLYLNSKPESLAYIPEKLRYRFLELIPEFGVDRIRVTTGQNPYTVPIVQSTSRTFYASFKENALFYNLCHAINKHGYDYTSKKFLSFLPTVCRNSIGGLFNWAVIKAIEPSSQLNHLKEREHKQKFKAYSTLDRTFQMLTIQEPIWFYNHLTNVKSYNVICESPITTFGRIEFPNGDKISIAFSERNYVLFAESEKGTVISDGKISDETEFVIGDDEILLTPDGLTVAEMQVIGDENSKVIDFNAIKNVESFKPIKPKPKMKPKAKTPKYE